MPTATSGPWLAQALARGLIRPAARPVRAPAPPPGCSERVLQHHVVSLAQANGWACYHTHDSRRSAAGWPDLALCRPPVLILAELKTDAGTTSAEQARWLELLGGCPGVRVRLWRPSLWSAIVAELTGGGR